MQITKIGYDRMLDAVQQQVKLKIKNVKVGTGTDYIPTKDDTDLHGQILWSGDVATCDVITDEVMDFLVIVPEHVGTQPWTMGEIGLYLDTGELFAMAVYPVPQLKLPLQRFRTHCMLLSPYLGSAVDLTLTWSMSLPRVNHYGQLPYPAKTGDNAYVVNFGSTKDNQIVPTLITRYAMSQTGPLAWGLMNGTIFYDGSFVNISERTFRLASPPNYPTPLYLLSWAFMYVYDGTGKTQCRAIRYNKDQQYFELPYESFSLTVASSVSPQSVDPCAINQPTPVPTQILNLDGTSKAILWCLPLVTETFGLWYQGRWDVSQGFPPAPVPGSFWVVSVGGVLNNISYQPQDWMVYQGEGVWDKVDNTELPYVLYKGTWDPTAGAFPPTQPTTIFTELRQGHYWKMSHSGTLGGVHFASGDYLIYEGAGAWGKWIGGRGGVHAGAGIRVDQDPTTEDYTVVNITENVHSISVVNTDPVSGVGAQVPVVMHQLQDTLNLEGNAGIALTTDPATNTVHIRNAGALLAFSQIASPGQPVINADSASDTLTLVNGGNMSITLNDAADTVTFKSADSPVDLDRTSLDYALKAYTKTDAAAAKVMAPENDIILGKALKVIFTEDPSSPTYIPSSDMLPGEYCSCTCTCTGPCNCCDGSGPI